MSNEKATQLKFVGKVSEYFSIWIVNLLLTLLTLGIYSAWAKVRKKKYLYSNTLVDGVGFDYHANPIAILKGRLIAFVIFLGYVFGGQLHAYVPVFFMLLFFFALPWLVVRSSIFNARNTSHRGLRFDFVGKVGEAFRVYVLLPITLVFTLWLTFPYISHQKNKLLIGNYKFGLSQFDFQAKVADFYRAYVFLIAMPLILMIIPFLAIQGYATYIKEVTQVSVTNIKGFAKDRAKNTIAVAENKVQLDSYLSDDVSSGVSKNAAQLRRDLSVTPESSRVGSNSVQEGISSVSEREELQKKILKDKLIKQGSVMVVPLYWILVGFLVLMFTGYVKARIGNLVWNATTLDRLSFRSSMRARDYIWIYFTNMMAIIITCGLAAPWAQIRIARYRASKFQVISEVDFDQFVGNKKSESQALGEELADFFDADFSLG